MGMMREDDRNRRERQGVGVTLAGEPQFLGLSAEVTQIALL